MDIFKALCCKERNRDHARKTRLRKKLAVDTMRSKMMILQEEALRLQAMKEEKDTANILLGLGGDENPKASNDIDTDRPFYEMKNGHRIYFLESDANKLLNELRIAVRHESSTHRQKRGSLAAALEAANSMTSAAVDNSVVETTAAGKRKVIEVNEDLDSDSDTGDDDDDGDEVISQGGTDGSQSIDEEVDGDGNPKKLRKVELLAAPVAPKTIDDIRRERNKIHARLTRDRKKIFTQRLTELLRGMEEHTARMRYKLGVVSQARQDKALPPKKPPQLSKPFPKLNQNASDANKLPAKFAVAKTFSISGKLDSSFKTSPSVVIKSEGSDYIPYPSRMNTFPMFVPPNIPMGPGMYPFPNYSMPGTIPPNSSFPGQGNGNPLMMLPFQGPPFDQLFSVSGADAASMQSYLPHPYFLPRMDMMPFLPQHQLSSFDMFSPMTCSLPQSQHPAAAASKSPPHLVTIKSEMPVEKSAVCSI